MTDELRAGLVRALERLADDLAVGRYEDPYVGFVVLVHPDRHPSIAVLSPLGATDLGSIVSSDPDETEEDRKKREAKGRFFDAEDLRLAHYALDDAWVAWQMSGYRKKDDPRSLGDYLMARVEEQYEARRDRKLKAELEKAEHRRLHPAVCEKCGRRFTERGLRMHLARNQVCGPQKKHDPADWTHCRRCPELRRNHPDGGPCVYPGCSCPGFEEATDTTGHRA